MPEPSYKEALDAIAKADYTIARGLLQACLERASAQNSGDLHYWMGWCCEFAPDGDKERALAWYQAAYEQSSDPVRQLESLYRAAWLCMGDRRWMDAAQLLGRALASAESAGLRHELYGHALYWHSGCLENQGFYFEAIAGYRKTARNAPGLAPECVFREIVCLNHIGCYEEALGACRSLGAEPPAGFDPRRFEEIRDGVERERARRAGDATLTRTASLGRPRRSRPVAAKERNGYPAGWPGTQPEVGCGPAGSGRSRGPGFGRESLTRDNSETPQRRALRVERA